MIKLPQHFANRLSDLHTSAVPVSGLSPQFLTKSETSQANEARNEECMGLSFAINKVLGGKSRTYSREGWKNTPPHYISHVVPKPYRCFQQEGQHCLLMKIKKNPVCIKAHFACLKSIYSQILRGSSSPLLLLHK